MKGLFSKIRISRKIVLAFGGVLVLCGATGAAAVFIGADKILGPSYADLNGLECTEIKTVTINKKDRLWVRKYITTNEPGDGMMRVKTALRVAGAVYDTDKPDLVQVVVLDKSGPTDRSAMRGRAVGADVIYIADPSHVPEGASGQVFTARYVDKPANADGLFYGVKIALSDAEIEKLVARLDDKTDCIKPEVALPEGHAAPAGHGEAAPADAHGNAAPAEVHGTEAAPAPDAQASEGAAHETIDPHGAGASSAAADAHATDAKPAGESEGWFSSLKSMVIGGGEERPIAGAPEGAAAEGHDAVPAESQEHAAPQGPDAAAPAAATEAAAGHDAVPAEAAASKEHDVAPVAEDKAKSAGAAWLEKLRAQPLEGGENGTAAGEPSADAYAGTSHGEQPTAEIPAEESLILPPKASDKKNGEQKAEAGH